MTNPATRAAVLFAAALLTGCGGGDPPQPKMSDDQIKEVMKKGKEENKRERGNGPPGSRG